MFLLAVVPSSGALLNGGDVSATGNGLHYINPGGCADTAALFDFDLDSTTGEAVLEVFSNCGGIFLFGVILTPKFGGFSATFDDCVALDATSYECGDPSIVGLAPDDTRDIAEGHYLYLNMTDSQNGDDNVRMNYICQDEAPYTSNLECEDLSTFFVGGDSQDKFLSDVVGCVFGFVSDCPNGADELVLVV